MRTPNHHDRSRTGRARTAVLSAILLVAGIGAVPTAVSAAPTGDTNNRGGSAALPQFDMDGDGVADLFCYAPGDDADMLWRSAGSGYDRIRFSVSGEYAPLTGDFNGDQKSDIFWYAPGPASDGLWTSTGSGFTGRSFSVSGNYRPFVGDFDGDGQSDIFLYAPGDAPDRIVTINGGSMSAVQFDIDGVYQPIPGDFDGDGDTDIFWYGPGGYSDGLWLSDGDGRNFSGGSQSVGGNYTPLTGDYNGDGRSDIFWYAPGPASDGLWTSRGDRTFARSSRSINGEYHPVGLNSVGEEPTRFAPAAPGARGEHVRLLQQRLRQLNYFVPRTDGVYDAITQQAVMAFQKYHGLGRDGVAGSQTIARLESASPARMREGGNHVEVDLSRQILMVNRNGKITVFNTSTGRPGWSTPPGRFVMNRQINGMRHAPLGQLWRPKYFNGGIAMHGSPSIPGHPASHGCTRLHNEAINHIWDANLVPLGTPVWVYF